MSKTRIVDNTNRPAQPEPGESEAVQSPAVREEAEGVVPGGREAVEQARAEERKRQTGQ